MSPEAFRFRPPRIPIDGPIEWSLLRAFGPQGAPVRQSFEPAPAIDWARKLGQSQRIAARQEFERLESEIGPALAREISIERAAIEAEAERLRRTARRIAERAAAGGIRVAFLKFLALELDGLLQPGSRPAVDADVLVDAERAHDLASVLERSGYRVADLPGSDHQLPLMIHPELAPVELHVLVPAVRVEGTRLANFGALERQHLLSAHEELPGACYLPSLAFRIAHATAHGVAQHGFSPDAYPMARLFGDLIDLGVTTPTFEAQSELAASWIRESVSGEESRAAFALCRVLARGALEELDIEPATDARRLLDHVLAGQIDRDYRRGLQLHVVRTGMSDRPTHRQLLRRLRGMVVKTDAELEMVYGRTRSAAHRRWLRVLRPFHLVWSLLRSLWGLLVTRLKT